MGKPHDLLFREVFARPVHARGLFQSVLPALLVAALDWDTLAPCPAEFLDHLQEHRVDLLFTVNFRGSSERLYLLLEHKSRPWRWTLAQMLAYEHAILTAHRRSHHKRARWPAVIKVVVHHGPRPWRGATDLLQLTEPRGLDALVRAELRPLLSTLPVLLDDLARTTEAAIRARPMSALGKLTIMSLQFMRSSPPDASVLAIRRWADLFQLVVASDGGPDGRDELASLDSYILQTTNLPPERLAALFAEVAGASAEATLMSTAERLVKQGLAQGIVKGQAELLLHLLVTRFGPLPEPIVNRVNMAGPVDFKRWTEAAVRAKSLDEVFAGD